MEPEGSLPHSQVSLSSSRSIQSMPPHPTSWKSILMLSSHLRLGLPSDLFPSGFSTKILYTPQFSSIHATCPAHLILLDWIAWTIFGEEYRSLSFSLCSFLHSPINRASSLLGPNMLLNNQFSNTLSLRSCLNVSDQISHQYTTTGKITVAGRNRSTGRKSCPSPTLSTTNLTWTDLGLNPGFLNGRPATNSLTHGRDL